MATKNNIVGMVHVKHGNILPFFSYFIHFHNSTEKNYVIGLSKAL